MNGLQGKTIFITGGSRGIGKAIALRFARDGANIIIAARTSDPHPKLEGTIHTTAQQIQQAGGQALAFQMDVRDEAQVAQAVAQAVERFGGIDILINNASAIQLSNTAQTTMKAYDLMMSSNVRGTFVTIQKCLPYLEKSANPHVLSLSPPLNMDAKWFKNHAAYTLSKYGMSMCMLGMAQEFHKQGIAFNALWPRTTIATDAVNMLGGESYMKASRKPEIMADAAYFIVNENSRKCTGQFFIDDEVLAHHHIVDLDSYAVTPGGKLIPDFFL